MKHTTGLIIFLLIIVSTGITACSSNPLQCVFQSLSLSRASDIRSGEFNILGLFSLYLDKSTLSADLTPVRKALLTDTLESVDLTNFLLKGTEPFFSPLLISISGAYSVIDQQWLSLSHEKP
jgi:hypothetical protein